MRKLSTRLLWVLVWVAIAVLSAAAQSLVRDELNPTPAPGAAGELGDVAR